MADFNVDDLRQMSDDELSALTKFYNSSNPNPSHVGLGAGLDNLFTGNLDYQRNLDSLAKSNEYNVNLAQMNNAFTAEQAALTRDFNAREAQKQRDWETYMSNSAYQRQAADLQAAGFNPALILGAGGASTPSGAVASAQTAHASGAGVPRGYYGSSGSGFGLLFNGLLNAITTAFKVGVGASAYTQRTNMMASSNPIHSQTSENIRKIYSNMDKEKKSAIAAGYHLYLPDWLRK